MLQNCPKMTSLSSALRQVQITSEQKKKDFSIIFSKKLPKIQFIITSATSTPARLFSVDEVDYFWRFQSNNVKKGQ